MQLVSAAYFCTLAYTSSPHIVLWPLFSLLLLLLLDLVAALHWHAHFRTLLDSRVLGEIFINILCVCLALLHTYLWHVACYFCAFRLQVLLLISSIFSCVFLLQVPSPPFCFAPHWHLYKDYILFCVVLQGVSIVHVFCASTRTSVPPPCTCEDREAYA